ncbi:DUF2975 domain-containing protein [Rhizorhabdus sp.]|uniref:DUF2975 domain-containing protein n=1 Tax=Rhizorhabdus sp. TaxID=1968843 RepID=UPI0019CC87C0|nr:DUF2975 domain-containing protein [Rhizorhabdus sp.]MBD3762886.1 DUF2975 domain-containing protein [Rhizorhabdus sp.]
MDREPNDLLLRASKVLLWCFMAIFMAGAALISLGLGTFLVWQTGLLGPIPDTAAGLNPANAPQLPLALLLALAATLMAFRFAQLLAQIVGSIAKDDPFTLQNADRLRTMALLALAYQAVSAGLFFLGVTVARVAPIEALVSGEEFSLSSLLLALTLFILARVFRYGAAMRADLEGTV